MNKLLLHTCCAPCSIAVIDELKNQYDLTVFFYNPNIFPEEEYLKRKMEVIRVCNDWNVVMIDHDYNQDKWNKTVDGLEKEPEGGVRCDKCFTLRLEETAKYADKNGFDLFATSLTSGRSKKAEIINPLGVMMGKKYNVKFLEADWKTEGRQEKGRKMVAERGIYRQNYCGCKYSIKK